MAAGSPNYEELRGCGKKSRSPPQSDGATSCCVLCFYDKPSGGYGSWSLCMRAEGEVPSERWRYQLAVFTKRFYDGLDPPQEYYPQPNHL